MEIFVVEGGGKEHERADENSHTNHRTMKDTSGIKKGGTFSMTITAKVFIFKYFMLLFLSLPSHNNNFILI